MQEAKEQIKRRVDVWEEIQPNCLNVSVLMHANIGNTSSLKTDSTQGMDAKVS